MHHGELTVRRLETSPTMESSTFGYFTGEALLAGVVGYRLEELHEVINPKCVWYEPRRKIKKSGGFRTLWVPHKALKQFQNRFLHYFLYRLLDRGFIDIRIRGFIPKSSHVRNASFHARPETAFTVRLDLKDAFPSVRVEQVRSALQAVIEKELSLYMEIERERRAGGVKRIRSYPNPPLFAWKKVKWFRRIFKGGKPWSSFDPQKVGEEFLQAILPLVTLKGAIPQGAPTSPFLLNLVLSHEGIPEKMYHWFRERGTDVRFSIYADDFTISSATPITKEAVEGCMEMIEQETKFRFNREKICFFDRRQGAPLVTGLRLVRIPEGSKSQRRVGDMVSVPKRKLRKIRGLIYRAIIEEKLRVKAKGYVDYLHGIYGPVLPPQVAVPWEKLRWRMN